MPNPEVRQYAKFHEPKIETMKRITGILFAAAVLLSAAHAGAQGPEPECAGEKLVRFDEQIAQQSLELNYLIWECYLDYVREMRIAPAIMNYPGLDYRAVCDTVPEIRALGKRLRAASEAYAKILQGDPKYKAIHEEYIALKGVDDPQRRNANKEQYNLMYERLRKKNKNYEPLLRQYREAERERNTALVRLLLDYYKAERRMMPTGPLFKSYSDTMRALRDRCPDIGRQEQELGVLRRLRGEVYEQMQRERFGVPKKHTGPAVSGSGS